MHVVAPVVSMSMAWNALMGLAVVMDMIARDLCIRFARKLKGCVTLGFCGERLKRIMSDIRSRRREQQRRQRREDDHRSDEPGQCEAMKHEPVHEPLDTVRCLTNCRPEQVGVPP